MTAFEEFIKNLKKEGYKIIEEDIDIGNGNTYIIVEDKENTKRYKIIIEEV